MEYYFIKKYGWKLAFACMPFFLLFIILLCCGSSGGSEEGVATAYFTTPFEDGVNYTITSNFGNRIDPITLDRISFHSGIDLSAPAGTSIVSCADGVVYEVGYSESGLGNYVYVEHDFGNLKMYSMYGHMLDDSIVVKVGDKVKAKQKVGTIGSTGRSTGIHLHFMISKNKISFNETDLLDPIIVIK